MKKDNLEIKLMVGPTEANNAVSTRETTGAPTEETSHYFKEDSYSTLLLYTMFRRIITFKDFRYNIRERKICPCSYSRKKWNCA